VTVMPANQSSVVSSNDTVPLIGTRASTTSGASGVLAASHGAKYTPVARAMTNNRKNQRKRRRRGLAATGWAEDRDFLRVRGRSAVAMFESLSGWGRKDGGAGGRGR